MNDIIVQTISPESAGTFALQLGAAGASPVVRLTSQGGDVGAALAMANAIASHGNVRVIADGMCASAAILLLVAAKYAEAQASTLLMIHRANGQGRGNAEDFDSAANSLRMADEMMKSLIAARVGSRVDELICDEDVWLDPQAALAYGLIDKILEQPSGQRENARALLDAIQFDKPTDKEQLMKVFATLAGPAPAPQPAPGGVNPAPAPAPQPNAEETRRTAIRAHGSDAPSSLVESVISSGVSPEAALAIFQAASTAGPGPANPLPPNNPLPGGIIQRDHASAKIQAMSDGILIRAGMLPDAPANEFRGMRMGDLRSHIQASGAGFATRGDFSHVLSNAANRAMSLMFEETEECWRTICRPIEVSDFRPTSLAALGLFPTPKVVPESGEIERGEPGDTGETTELETRALLFPITRKAIVNDDTAQFAMIAERMASAASRGVGDALAALVESEAGVTLDDEKGLFHADRSNTLAVSVDFAGLKSARTKLRLLKDPSGIVAGATPRHLWTSVALETDAKSVLRAQWVPTVAGNAVMDNPVQAMLPSEGVCPDYRLDAHNGGTGDSWYLVGADQFAVLLLRGQTAPMVDQDQPLDYDGYCWRVLWDFRVWPTGHYRIVRGNR